MLFQRKWLVFIIEGGVYEGTWRPLRSQGNAYQTVSRSAAAAFILAAYITFRSLLQYSAKMEEADKEHEAAPGPSENKEDEKG